MKGEARTMPEESKEKRKNVARGKCWEKKNYFIADFAPHSFRCLRKNREHNEKPIFSDIDFQILLGRC